MLSPKPTTKMNIFQNIGVATNMTIFFQEMWHLIQNWTPISLNLLKIVLYPLALVFLMMERSLQRFPLIEGSEFLTLLLENW